MAKTMQLLGGKNLWGRRLVKLVKQVSMLKSILAYKFVKSDIKYPMSSGLLVRVAASGQRGPWFDPNYFEIFFHSSG